MIKKQFKKIHNGLLTLGVVLGLGSGLVGCQKFTDNAHHKLEERLTKIQLQNNYEANGFIDNYYGLVSNEDLLSESKIMGRVEYVGFEKENEKKQAIDNIIQTSVGGAGLIAGRGSENNIKLDREQNVVIVVQDENRTKRVLYFEDKKIPSSVLLDYIKVGDTISFPTLRLKGNGNICASTTGWGLHENCPWNEFEQRKAVDSYTIDEIKLVK